MADDYSANTATTGRVTVRIEHRQIEVAGDIDCFAITLSAGLVQVQPAQRHARAALDPIRPVDSACSTRRTTTTRPARAATPNGLHASYSGVHYLAAGGGAPDRQLT
jgi:hypothetical protein